MTHKLFATCRFGLEAVVASELKNLGIPVEATRDAKVSFCGGSVEIARANLFLRTAERVFLEAGSFFADTFDALYEGTKALAWEGYIPKDAKIIVKGKQARSKLHSVSDVQSIVKKAIVDRLAPRYGLIRLPETGKAVIVEAGLLLDNAVLALDSSGAGLARRGYHTLNVQAPLSETLAAALVLLSRWDKETPLWDPFCGSGTIPIEAQMIAMDIAPGLNREFAYYEWDFLEKKARALANEEARERQSKGKAARVFGSDIDERALGVAKTHAKQAGVKGISFKKMDVSAFKPDGKPVVVCNPPYGERLGSKAEAERLFRDMGKAFRAADLESVNVLCAHTGFERFYGQRATKRRNLYNSGLKCQLFRFE